MLKVIKGVKSIIVILIFILFIVFLLSRGPVYERNDLSYGVTFSKKQAIQLGLNWQQLFLSMLDELGVKKLRLAAYWDEIEPVSGTYEFNDLDWQINEASQRGVQIILAVGGRLPRWPECHFPAWSDTLTKPQREQKILYYINTVIKHYQDNERIVAWQVENEPFLTHFGECPKLDASFLDTEISLVKDLDNRPIIVTDSGELSVWVFAARRADIFGTTMYRDTYSKALKRYIHYPISPGFFRFKKNIARLFSQANDWIVIELQAEPWTPVPFQFASQEDRDRTMNVEKFKEILEFARMTGFKEFYLWGVEYWYWEKEVNGDAGMWNEAKILFQ